MHINLSNIVNIIILAVLLSSCGTARPSATTDMTDMPGVPGASTAPGSSGVSGLSDIPDASGAPPLSDIQNGTWTCVDENNDTPGIDPVDILPIPDTFEGKSMEEISKFTESIGRGDIPSLIWAMDGRISPDGEYATYLSNKDCIGDKQIGGMSIYLLDIKTNEERILAKSKNGQYYSALWWIDDTSIFCHRTINSSNSEYIICKVTGEIIPLILEGSAPILRAHQDNFFAYSDPTFLETVIRVSYINEEASAVEYKQYKQSQDYLMAECAISSDHTKMALKVRQDHYSAERSIIIWDIESDSCYEIKNPVIENTTDVSAIDFNWDEEFLQVNFLITNDSGQHNELWQYKY